MTRLRVRVGRWLAREAYGVDLGDYDDANELFNLATERLSEWADGDIEPGDFVSGYDVGTLCAFISAGIHITTRTVLHDVIDRLSADPDIDPLTAVRLAELRTHYFDGHLELPEESSD